MYFAFVVETPRDAYAIKVLADSAGAARKRVTAMQFPGGLVELHDVGSCEFSQVESDKLYEKACKRAAVVSAKLKPVVGCNKSTGSMF